MSLIYELIDIVDKNVDYKKDDLFYYLKTIRKQGTGRYYLMTKEHGCMLYKDSDFKKNYAKKLWSFYEQHHLAKVFAVDVEAVDNEEIKGTVKETDKFNFNLD